MHRNTVKLGLNLITAGISLVIAATFFHQEIASLLFLSTAVEERFLYLGLFWGSAAGCAGIIVGVAGFLRSETGGSGAYLMPSLIMLVSVIVLFFVLLLGFFRHPEPQMIRPGETIQI